MIAAGRIRLVGSFAFLVTLAGLSRGLTARTNADGVGHTPYLEITGGMITGDRVGASFESRAAGLVGGGFAFPVVKRLDLRAQYLFSNQDRRFLVFPGSPDLPGSIVLTASSLHIMLGAADVALRNWGRGKLYLSPGGGWVRNSSRELVISDASGSSSGANPAGNAPFASLGIGYWARVSDSLGIRLELRHFVSGGGTGQISLAHVLSPSVIGAVQPTLGKMPVQNNVAFTISFTFRLR